MFFDIPSVILSHAVLQGHSKLLLKGKFEMKQQLTFLDKYLL